VAGDAGGGRASGPRGGVAGDAGGGRASGPRGGVAGDAGGGRASGSAGDVAREADGDCAPGLGGGVAREADGDRTARSGGEVRRDAGGVPGRDAAADFFGDPTRAWDLGGLHEIYVDLLDRHRPLLDRARSGRVGSAEALVARTALMDAWRTLPNVDPELPRELLRTPFPRAEARALFVELYDCLAPLAEARVRQVVGAHDPELSRLVRAHDSKPRR